MNLDYETLACISYNLGDAHEELTHLLESVRPGAEIDEAEFRDRMAHLYSHLNIAWNVRNASANEIDAVDDERMRALSRYRADLEPFP